MVKLDHQSHGGSAVHEASVGEDSVGSDPTGPALKVRDLTTRLGGRLIHDHLNLTAERQAITAILGPSGEGKSVLLRVILGLVPFESGEIGVLGIPRKVRYRDPRTDPMTRKVGVLFQNGALFSNLTVRENIMAPMKAHIAISDRLAAEIADIKINLVGLDKSAANKKPGQLSGGMRKRAALARAIALDPPLLFLDEPTAGLDPIGADAFDNLILELRHTLDISVIMVTHDLDSLAHIVDQALVLKDGQIIAQGPPASLAQNDNAWVRDYLTGPRGRAAFTG